MHAFVGSQMKDRTVSIIIPVYNEEECLPLCLNSIGNLHYPGKNIEVIVVDNGSADRTREIARSYGVRVLRDDTMSVSGLRNLGADSSKGDVLAFVDADCVVSKDWLDNAEIYFDNMEVSAWGAPPIPPDGAGATWIQRTWYLVRQMENELQEVEWLESMNLFVRKKQFVSIGGFNETLVTCEDVDLCYRIRSLGNIIADSRLKVVHLGEARTLKEFIQKETWRGKSNLEGIRSHGLSLKELPSLSIPFYFGILFPVSVLGFVSSWNPIWFVASFLVYLFPSVVVLFKVRKKRAAPLELARLLFLLQIYFFSRTVAVAKRP